MSANMTDPEDPYVLSRDLAATARLNLQHYIWKEELGYLLHSSLPADTENVSVADVGTGTGIWLLDLAHKLPASARLEGLDICLDLTPPTEWLPANVSFRHFNIFHDVPEDMVEKYDIVHARLLILVVKNNDPLPVLRQLLRLLKPGGYLQWGEVDLSNRKTVKTNPENSSKTLQQLQNDVQALVHSPFSSWPVDLAEKFEMQGMTHVITDKKWTRDEYLSFVQVNNLLIQEEIMNKVAGAEKERLQEVFAEAVLESRKGVAWNIQRLNTIGRKARTGVH